MYITIIYKYDYIEVADWQVLAMPTESMEEQEKTRSKILPRKHTEIHGRKYDNKILMPMKSTEEHGKIRS